jgi:hypothetical protein
MRRDTAEDFSVLSYRTVIRSEGMYISDWIRTHISFAKC